jgi:excisionase family DNA binding protein
MAAAVRQGVCAETVRRWIRAGQLKAVKVGGRVYVYERDVVKLEQPVVPHPAVVATEEGGDRGDE